LPTTAIAHTLRDTHHSQIVVGHLRKESTNKIHTWIAMGYTISGVIIDKLPEPIQKDNGTPFDTKYQIESNTSLCPKKLTIGFKNEATYIFLDNIYYKNMSEEEGLTQLESDINKIFPGSGFLSIMMNETSDIYGYSLINRGKKTRTKCVMQGRQFLDFGELNPLEQKLEKEIQEYLKDKPNVKAKIDEHTKSMSQLDASKFHLIYRDKLYSRNKLANPYEYLGGGLDSYVIDKLFQGTAKCDFQEIERTEAVVFDKKKLNFTKESLSAFIYTAFEQLNRSK
jgi:hypothetical protein